MAEIRETVEIVKVKVVKLTEAECLYALDILRTAQNETQVYGGEINEIDSSGVYALVQELKKCAHVIEVLEQLMDTAIRERLCEELLLRIKEGQQ